MSGTKQENKNLNESDLSPNFLTLPHIAALCYAPYLEAVLSLLKVRTDMSYDQTYVTWN